MEIQVDQPRYKPFRFRNGKTTKNRVVIPPMASQTADSGGFASEQTLEHYTRLAETGAGIVFAEYTFIHPSGRGEANQLGVDSDDKIEGLRRIAEILRKTGSLTGLQIVHVGGKSTPELTGGPLLGASPIRVPVKGWQPERPTPMSEHEIENLVEWYVSAARRAHVASFDFVELHAAHGYGLNQWLSPVTNQREDAYGRTIKGRAKLLFTIVGQIRARLPELLLAVRLPAQDHFAGGLEVHEMAWVVRQLEEIGVDLIDVSSGLGGWRRTDNRTHEGYLVADAAMLKSHVAIPVIGVGGIETGEFIDKIICDKRVDFAAVGRAILRDPHQWGALNLSSVG